MSYKNRDGRVTSGSRAIETKINNNVDEYAIAYRDGYSSYERTFVNHDANISVKSDFTPKDYSYFRPGERIPQTAKQSIPVCMTAYQQVGIVRNTIDLMGDFGCHDMKLIHPQKSVQRFMRRWFQKVNGNEVSERFLNYLYRTGNVFVNRKTGKMTVRQVKKMKSATGTTEDIKLAKREIPTGYSFLNPKHLDSVGDEISVFAGQVCYVIKLGNKFRSAINEIKRLGPAGEKKLESIMQSMPQAVKFAITNNHKHYPLGDDISAYFYKKDDWQSFAFPMVHCILGPLTMLEKMHLADMAALDGAISNIRLWKVGYIDEKNPNNSIIPGRPILNKLRNILHHSVTGGVIDLVWGPALDFKESSTSVHQFLGPKKYEQVMRELYEGLGLPSGLTGSGTGSFNNNYVSMQTFLKRLEYGRKKLAEFWNKEFKLVADSLGFKKAPVLHFGELSLSDDATRNKLILDLIDRDLISAETVLEYASFMPDVEKARLISEQKSRLKNRMPEKAGPYHNAEQDHDLRKIVLQGGGVVPSEVGLELMPRKDGEVPMLEQREKLTQKNKSPNDAGRPKSVKDSTKRKQREIKPRTADAEFTSRMVWAGKAQEELNSILSEYILAHYKKKNLRSLSNQEKEVFEEWKFRCLSNIEPYAEITKELVYKTLEQDVNKDMAYVAQFLCHNFISKNEREPSIDEMKQIQSSAYSLYYEPDPASEDNIII